MGDLPGHPFRGNQWTGGATVTALRGTEHNVERFRRAWERADLTRIGLPDARKGAKVALRVTGGFYQRGSDVLAINPGEEAGSEDDLVDQITHELAHRVWANALSDEQRKLWETESQKATEFVSAYAKSGGPEEDFAETVRAVFRGHRGRAEQRLHRVLLRKAWKPARRVGG